MEHSYAATDPWPLPTESLANRVEGEIHEKATNKNSEEGWYLASVFPVVKVAPGVGGDPDCHGPETQSWYAAIRWDR
jgi:hypothetical protein